ncbi:uncharacterized protein BDV17DRAFT_161992 [Aspergillus undulatus]|uniref:uncharacterized protein n=1 Tax=Aspergillus undulatus TaxID=1810928 RepID=UPI003CCD4897
MPRHNNNRRRTIREFSILSSSVLAYISPQNTAFSSSFAVLIPFILSVLVLGPVSWDSILTIYSQSRAPLSKYPCVQLRGEAERRNLANPHPVVKQSHVVNLTDWHRRVVSRL